MDKRVYITTKYYHYNDKEIPAKIYLRKGAYKDCLRFVYGEIEGYVTDRYNLSLIDKLLYKSIKKYENFNVDRPFMIDGVYIYVLGVKKYFTNDIKKKDSQSFYYVSKTCKDPLKKYKEDFLKYLQTKVVMLGNKMNVDLSNYKIRCGLYLTYFGCFFPTKKQFKFDYRLYAYKEEILDSVIYHEITHYFEKHHNQRFYDILYAYLPEYDHLDRLLKEGKFEGEVGNYLL